MTSSWTPKFRRRPAIALVLATHAVLAFGFLVATPMGEAPDEPSHVQYVMFLREEHSLPIVPADGAARLPQGKHPPLYYLLGALFSAGGDFKSLGFTENPHFSYRVPDDSKTPAFVHPEAVSLAETPGEVTGRRLRFVSLLAGLLTVWATWALGRTVWPDRDEMAVASAAVVGFMPAFAFTAGIFNNDALAAAWSAVIVWLSVKLAVGISSPLEATHTSGNFRDRFGSGQPALAITLGVVLGLALITKLTTLPIFGVATVAVLWRARVEGLGWLVKAGALVGGAGLLVGGWWPVRNIMLYGFADPFGLRRWAGSIPHLERIVPLQRELGTYLTIQFTSFWGRFGWVNVPLPVSVYITIAVACALAVAGLFGLLIGFRALQGQTKTGLMICLLAAILAYASALRLGITLNLVAAHGRYLNIALAPLSVLLVSGLVGLLPPRASRVASGALIAGMLGLGTFSLFGVLIPAYRPPAPLTAPELEQTAGERLDIDFDGRLHLVSLSVRSGPAEGEEPSSRETVNAEAITQERVIRVEPGGRLIISPVWQSLRALWLRDDDENGASEAGVGPLGYTVFVHVLDSDGEVVGRVDSPFDGRHPAAAWPPGAAYRSRIEVPIAPGARPGKTTLLIGLYPLDAPEDRLLATAADGTPLGDSHRLERLVITSPAGPAQPAPTNVRGDMLYGSIGPGESDALVELVGFDIESSGQAGSKAVVLTLYWRALDPIERDLQVLVHLADETGRPVIQADGPPSGGRLPTSLWAEGELVVDRRVIERPAQDTEAGGEESGSDADTPLRILVGLYDLASGERLSATAINGEGWPDGVIDLGLVGDSF